VGDRRVIPIAPAADDDCSGAEPFALRVIGDSMAPEFADGDVVVVEPDGHAADGSFVIAQVGGEWMLRMLRVADGRLSLRTLDPADPPIELPGPAAIRGVVIQKSKPGRRRAAKRYVG
jgi:SOS-response transcriptional repressor LexA